MTTTTPARRRRALLVLAVVSLTGCGVPVDGAARVVEPSAVPTALLQPAEDAGPGATAESRPAASGPAVAFTSTTGLRLVPKPGNAAEPIGAEQALLDTLVAGPTDAERTLGLATALPPSLRLTVSSLDAGLLTVEVAESEGAAPADDASTAIGQIVLTATSLPAVHAIALVRDGTPIPVPKADGVSTTSPLTADEFAPLLDAPAGS